CSSDLVKHGLKQPQPVKYRSAGGVVKDVLVARQTWRGQSDGTRGQRRAAYEGELPVRQPGVGRRTVIGARPYYAPPRSDDVRSSGAAHKWPRSPGCIVLAVETLVGFRKEPVLFRR